MYGLSDPVAISYIIESIDSYFTTATTKQQLAANLTELFNTKYKTVKKYHQMSRSGAFIHKAITNTKDKK